MGDLPATQIIDIEANQSVAIQWHRGRSQNSSLRLSIFESDLWRVAGEILTPDKHGHWFTYDPAVDVSGNPHPFAPKKKAWKIKVEAAVSDVADGEVFGPHYRGMARSTKLPITKGGIQYIGLSFFSNPEDKNPNTEMLFHIT
jgi:hypothetical protein